MHLARPPGRLPLHAWDDRQHSSKELHDLLEAVGVAVWFSGKNVLLALSPAA